MLEKIVLSISTAIFFVCSFIVNSIFSSYPAEAPTAESAITVSATVRNADAVSLVGKWSGVGKLIEFTDDGRIMCDKLAASYRLDGNILTVSVQMGKAEHIYKAEIEFIDENNIRLGSVSLRKVQ